MELLSYIFKYHVREAAKKFFLVARPRELKNNFFAASLIQGIIVFYYFKKKSTEKYLTIQ